MRKQPPSIWVTRSAPYDLLTAQRLRGMSFHVITVPLLEVRQLPCEKALARPEMLAFISVHGVRHHPFDSEWADVPVLAVGDTTAAAVRRSGYLEGRSAGGAVADLQTLALRSATSGSRVIHFGALEPAGDFAGYLSRRGFDAMHVPVYETEPCVEGADLLLAGNSGVDGVLVHSPKAGRLACQLDRKDLLERHGSVLVGSLRGRASPFPFHQRLDRTTADRAIVAEKPGRLFQHPEAAASGHFVAEASGGVRY
ncbi:uroporphyrinogen-III synthase [Sphingomonas glaciei]|uniref:Uroporphyrinogen-III synthase n=1 Tax=Sphingomonas glaciei TaxID=2938948 RepID=A0ABY5MZU6_9SPHN|nr:uroporphyrinogen-III synthase [Sphingomonas glaciei]UUR09326.1 uroporphyrinogen-III synthase [Sphingomonas glaciei]